METKNKIKRMKFHNEDAAIQQEFYQQAVDKDKLALDITAYNEDGSKFAIIYDNQGVPAKKYYIIILEKTSVVPLNSFEPVDLWQVIRFQITDDAIDAMCYADMILN